MKERAIGLLFFAACALLSGCASSSAFARADCERQRMQGYNVLVCNDAAVGEHCAKGGRIIGSPHSRYIPLADNGKMVDYQPRACFEFYPLSFHRKPFLVIGKSYMNCAFHEIGHWENPWRPEWVEKNIPCVGDRRK